MTSAANRRHVDVELSLTWRTRTCSSTPHVSAGRLHAGRWLRTYCAWTTRIKHYQLRAIYARITCHAPLQCTSVYVRKLSVIPGRHRFCYKSCVFFRPGRQPQLCCGSQAMMVIDFTNYFCALRLQREKCVIPAREMLLHWIKETEKMWQQCRKISVLLRDVSARIVTIFCPNWSTAYGLS